MKKIMDSEIDGFGRIGIFITMCAATVLLNLFLDGGYKVTTPYIIQLLISFVAGAFGLLCILMGLVVVGLLIACIEWIFTGEFFGGPLTEGSANIFSAVLTFLIYFFYGNWWRSK
jgi:hypothetical protein